MGRDLGVSTSTVFAAFSVALLVAAALGPLAGRRIDLYGGGPVLGVANLMFAVGLSGLAFAQGPVSLFAAWLAIGIGMGTGLYEAGFASLIRLYGHKARGPMIGITLIGGFASTVGWPLSVWFESAYGWRGACLAWAGLHLILGLPLNLSLPKASGLSEHDAGPSTLQGTTFRPQPSPPAYVAWLLALVFAISWFIGTAMAAHLPRLLQLSGVGLVSAVAVAALIGPAQVAARLLEFGLLRHAHPFLCAQVAALAHPIGAVCLLIFGGPAAVAFTVLHGAGNGVLTIAQGSLPLAIFGTNGYGVRQGLLMIPARFAQAFAPFLFGLLIDRWGSGALWMGGLLGMANFAVLLVLRRRSKIG